MKKLITTLAIVLFVSSTPAASCETRCPDPEPCPVCEECETCETCPTPEPCEPEKIYLPCEPCEQITEIVINVLPDASSCWELTLVDLPNTLTYAGGNYYGGFEFYENEFNGITWEGVELEHKLRTLWDFVDGHPFKIVTDDWRVDEDLVEALTYRRLFWIWIWTCEEPQDD